MYVVMLTGAGPTRAFVERVTHVVYLATVHGDVVQVQPFPDMDACVAARGLHHTVMEHGGNKFVSLSLPSLPRNFVASAVNGLLFPLRAETIECAREELVSWCAECCKP